MSMIVDGPEYIEEFYEEMLPIASDVDKILGEMKYEAWTCRAKHFDPQSDHEDGYGIALISQ